MTSVAEARAEFGRSAEDFGQALADARRIVTELANNSGDDGPSPSFPGAARGYEPYPKGGDGLLCTVRYARLTEISLTAQPAVDTCRVRVSRGLREDLEHEARDRRIAASQAYRQVYTAWAHGRL